MNTPIYLALLVAVLPAAKERLASYIACAALADQGEARGHRSRRAPVDATLAYERRFEAA